jgi:hypothetical protein
VVKGRGATAGVEALATGRGATGGGGLTGTAEAVAAGAEEPTFVLTVPVGVAGGAS